jgi:putative flippase GtrA
MSKKDIIFATICGLSVAWVAVDFLGSKGWIFFIILPILSISGLYITELVGKRFLFIHQVGKFALGGAFVSVVDIKVFQLIFWLLPFSLTVKAISFIIATLVKYWGDKHWTFEKPEKQDIGKELAKFFMVATTGLLINVVSFYIFGKIDNGLSDILWMEASIIFASLVVASWNFIGYKFIVFKR